MDHLSINPNDILGAAQAALTRAQEAPEGALGTQSLAVIEDAPLSPYEPAPPPSQSFVGEKFPDFPTQLREAEGVNLHDVKKHHLAALVESLERTIQAHESFPTPDAAIAVSSLSEQVQKMTKDLEKSQDPKILMEAIVFDALEPFATSLVRAVVSELKWLRQETRGLVLPDKHKIFDDVVNKATERLGPSMNDSLELTKLRLMDLLQIKPKGGRK